MPGCLELAEEESGGVCMRRVSFRESILKR